MYTSCLSLYLTYTHMHACTHTHTHTGIMEESVPEVSLNATCGNDAAKVTVMSTSTFYASTVTYSCTGTADGTEVNPKKSTAYQTGNGLCELHNYTKVEVNS